MPFICTLGEGDLLSSVKDGFTSINVYTPFFKPFSELAEVGLHIHKYDAAVSGLMLVALSSPKAYLNKTVC